MVFDCFTTLEALITCCFEIGVRLLIDIESLFLVDSLPSFIEKLFFLFLPGVCCIDSRCVLPFMRVEVRLTLSSDFGSSDSTLDSLTGLSFSGVYFAGLNL